MPTEADSAKAATSPTSKASPASTTRSSSICQARPPGTAGTIKEKTKEGAEKTKEGAEKVGEKTKEGAEKVGEKTKEGAEKVVDKTKEGLSKTGEVITDGWITTRVQVEVRRRRPAEGQRHQRRHEGSRRHAEGHRDVRGRRARAVAEAKEVEGVRSVVDHLTIGPKKP